MGAIVRSGGFGDHLRYRKLGEVPDGAGSLQHERLRQGLAVRDPPGTLRGGSPLYQYGPDLLPDHPGDLRPPRIRDLRLPGLRRHPGTMAGALPQYIPMAPRRKYIRVPHRTNPAGDDQAGYRPAELDRTYLLR